MTILKPSVSRSGGLVSRPSTLVDSGNEYVVVLRESVFPDPCPFDGLPCVGVLNLCFHEGLDSVDRPVIFERCKRYVAFFERSGGI